jgi:hypothetical protein
MREKIDKLYRAIKEANEKLEDLRKECPHEDYCVMYYSWRVGSMSLKRLCKQCDQVVGDPTDSEIEEYKSRSRKPIPSSAQVPDGT